MEFAYNGVIEIRNTESEGVSETWILWGSDGFS